MQISQSTFGRRSHPHRITVASGGQIRTFSLPSWAAWTGLGLAAIAFAWLIGSTVYIAFTDEIFEATKAHRLTVERAYEDRIATLRRQIDEINTRQFLDQQSFESRLEALLSRQTALEQRHYEIAGLFGEARERKLTIDLDSTPAQAAQAGGLGLFTSTAHAAAFDPSRPAPLDATPASKSGKKPTADGQLADRIQASIERVEMMQSSMLDSIETTVDDVADSLAEVSISIGAALPEAAVEEAGVGGPLIELRGTDGSSHQDRQIDRIRDDFDRFDVLRSHVSRLPVRAPLSGDLELSSGFGRRLDPFLKRPAIHTGLDFRASSGTPVYAVAGGRATVAGYTGGYGRLIEIDHGNGYRTRYGHLSRILIAPGSNVAPGDKIGLVGTTGRSTGPHLHYETRVSGSVKDPMPFIEAAQLLPEGY